MADFEVVDREIEIKTDGRVERSPIPQGVDPSTFRHLLAAIDLLYRLNAAFPSVDQIRARWDFDLGWVREMLTTPELKKALAIRGIELDLKAGLSYEQLQAITLLSNPDDRRTESAKAASAGISMPKLRAWKRNPQFSAALAQQAEHNLADAIPLALNRLVSKADEGDLRAIEKVLEITGRHDPNMKEVQNARTIVLTFMEVLQSELDAEVLKRVMDKVQGRMQVMSITQGLKEL